MEEIIESYYYDRLGVRSTASLEEIKQAFYVKAAQLCPTRNPNVPNAAEKYQALTIAYEVLSDPVQRAAYDREEGYNQLREKLVDPAEAFKDYIGQLIFQSDAVSGQLEGIPLEFDDKLKTVMTSVRKEREKELAGKLIAFLDRYVQGDKDTFTHRATSEAQRLSSSAYQVDLLHMIGQTYSSQAAEELGKRAIWLGIPFLIARYRNKSHYSKSLNIIEEEVLPVMQAQEEMRQLKEMYGPEKEHGEAESSNAVKVSESLVKDEKTLAKKIWKLTAADIHVTIVNVCQMVLNDNNVTKRELNDRAMSLKILGRIFEEQQAAGSDGGLNTTIRETERGEILVLSQEISGLIESDNSSRSSSEVVFPCLTQAIMRVMDCFCNPRPAVAAAANADSGEDRTEESTESDTSHVSLSLMPGDQQLTFTSSTSTL